MSFPILQKLLSLRALAGRQPFCIMNHPFMPSLQWVDAAAAKVGLSLMGSFVDRNCSAVAGERIIVDR
jgi:hypothetical protein